MIFIDGKSSGLGIVLDKFGEFRPMSSAYFGVCLRISNLVDKYRSEYQIRVVVNVLKDIMGNAEGVVVRSGSNDIFFICHQNYKELIDDAMPKIKYLFFDDPLLDDFDISSDFFFVYDLYLQWDNFIKACMKAFDNGANNEFFHASDSGDNRVCNRETSFNICVLNNILSRLRFIDIEKFCNVEEIFLERQKSYRSVIKKISISIPILLESVLERAYRFYNR